MPVHAIIFDMGNTLIQYVPTHLEWRATEEQAIAAIHQVLAAQGHAGDLAEAACVELLFTHLEAGWSAAVAGQANLQVAQWIATGLAEAGVTIPETVLPELVAAYAAPRRLDLTACPGAVAVLAELKARGYRLGLISNTMWPQELHVADLEQLGLLPHLDHLIFSCEVGVWKPNPAIFQTAAAALGIDHTDAIFVGDNPREDIRGAQVAGMRAVWVQNAEFALNDVQPDHTISHLAELLGVVTTLEG